MKLMLMGDITARYRVYDRKGHEFRDVVGYSVMKGEFTEIIVETDYGIPRQIDGKDLEGLVMCECTDFCEDATGNPIYASDIVQCMTVDSDGEEVELKGAISMGLASPEIYILESEGGRYPEGTCIPMHNCHGFSIIGNGLESL